MAATGEKRDAVPCTASQVTGGLRGLWLLAGLEGLEHASPLEEGPDRERHEPAHDAIGEEPDDGAEDQLTGTGLAETVDVVGPGVRKHICEGPAEEAGDPVIPAVAENREGDL